MNVELRPLEARVRMLKAMLEDDMAWYIRAAAKAWSPFERRRLREGAEIIRYTLVQMENLHLGERGRGARP